MVQEPHFEVVEMESKSHPREKTLMKRNQTFVDGVAQYFNGLYVRDWPVK